MLAPDELTEAPVSTTAEHARTAVLAGSGQINEPFAAPPPRRRGSGRSLFDSTWPKVAAVAIFVFAWQCVVWSGWRAEHILPGPRRVASSLWELSDSGVLWRAVGYTFQRAAVGFAVALAVGVALGIAVSSSKVVRRAIGSMITGIQTMPSIAWFPLAIVLFQLSEGAIRFVVVLGAAPAIANGLIAGIDHVPPILLRAGQVIGARGVKAYRHVILPASLPSFVGGLKQGWAFAWRSLMAGELLVIIASRPSIGQQMQQARSLSRYSDMVAWMVVVFVIGLLVDALAFGTLDRAIRRRWGLLSD
jgi:NitT/TauT family transport system permease protein